MHVKEEKPTYIGGLKWNQGLKRKKETKTQYMYYTEAWLGKCPVVCFPAQGRVGEHRLSSAALKMPLLLQPSGNTCQLVS